MDLGLAHVLIGGMRDEAAADRVAIVSGRNENEVWKEVNAASLPAMFQTFRVELVNELNKRFELNTMPNRHVLLALKMNPSLNTKPDSPQLLDKSAKAELMSAEYKRALRRQAILIFKQRSSAAAAPTLAPAAPTLAPAAAATAPTAAATPGAATPAAATAVVAPPSKRRKHIVAPSLCENSLALIHGVNALRHRALAASGCPGPKDCRRYPAIEGCSTRST